MTVRRISHADWLAEAERRFGKYPHQWAFVCPVCGHVATIADWLNAGASESAVAFSCIGRYRPGAAAAFSGKPGPCNYAGGGLFRLNPVHVVFPDGSTRETFEFADTPPNMTTPIERTTGEPTQETRDADPRS